MPKGEWKQTLQKKHKADKSAEVSQFRPDLGPSDICDLLLGDSENAPSLLSLPEDLGQVLASYWESLLVR